MKIKQSPFQLIFQEHHYDGVVTFKRMKRMTFRMRNNILLVSSPFGIPLSTVETLTLTLMPKILKRYQPIPTKQDATLWFGSWRAYDSTFSQVDRSNPLFIKKALLNYSVPRVAYWCRQLSETIIPPKVCIRSMISRWGTYSKKTHRITLSSTLVAFDPSWIDAVIAHECVHIVHLDHSSRFYATLHRLLPTYEETHAKLKRGYPNANLD